MGFTLAAYGINAFQEFIMPQIDNADYSVILSKKIYGINDNIRLNFEILNGVWRFVSTSKNVHVRSQSLHLGMELEVGSLIQLRQDDVKISILVMELDQNLTRFNKYRIVNPCNLSIGAAEGCNIVYDFQSLISRSHAVLEISSAACKITDTSRNGIYMDGQRIREARALNFGDVINIFGLQIIWLGAVLAIGTTGQSIKVWSTDLELLDDSTALYPNGYRQLDSGKKNLFHRSPRMLPKLHTEDIEIESVPQPTKIRQRPLLLQIGPPMTMVLPMLLGTVVAFLAASSSGYGVSPYMYTGIVIAAASALLGVMWALLNLRQAKKENALEEQNRITRYVAYLEGVEQDIITKAQENCSILENAYPPVSVCAGYDAYCPMLWSRNTIHPDVLFTRLGLGDTPFQCKIKIPKKTFTLYDDDLAEQPKIIHDSYQVLHNVPVGIDLANRRLLGVVGDGKMSTAAGIVRAMAIQLAANTCYTDVKLVFIGSDGLLQSGGEWGFARWLPHVWSESKVTRFCACSHAEITEVCSELSETIRIRNEGQKASEAGTIVTPYYVIFIESLELLQNESIVKYLLEPQAGNGVTTVIMANGRELLPNVCENIIEVHGSHGSIYNLAEGVVSGTELTFDVISPQAAEQFARKISGVEVSEIETGGAIPDSLTFLDMWKVKTIPELNVLERWRKNRTYDTMCALIGERAGGRGCYLDIHEKHHGPHGLLAGTTGSGKSETLQTYMLSMAINYSPDDIAFFVIDYKGGGMANLFSNLPHMTGQISNLSGNQVHRAMVSIKSENRRRQQLFNECGVNHIDSYTRLYKNGETTVPLPHLLIIIDEFAELKKEEGSFMRELISVAQVGRSLGVHLILATQKPDGTVDDNIRCNAKFRICLRVQDRQDSNEMLHRPDAAYITQAGRAFMQVGNDEIFEEFQSGWSGADYDETLANGNTNIASIRTNTGKPAIMGNYLKKQQRDSQRRQWLRRLMELSVCAANQLGQPIPQLVEDPRKQERLIRCIYEKLEKEHLDYPQGKSNELRLKGFLRIFAEHIHEDWRDDGVIRRIVAQMNQQNLKIPERKEQTQLTAVVDYLAQLAEENGYSHSFRLWLPVLPERLCLNQVKGYGKQIFDGVQWFENTADWTLDAVVGLSDNPANQVQDPMMVSFSENGNLAICGSAGSGKSKAENESSVTWTEGATKPTISDSDSVKVVNGSEAPWEFVVDKKAPDVSVSYDNNAVANGKYFKKERTATITVEDKYIDSNQITVTCNTKDYGNVTPGQWKQNGDKHTIEYKFTVPKGMTGEFALSVSCEDYAGNTNSGWTTSDDTEAAEEFIIDKESPEVTVKLVEGPGTYKETVKGTVRGTDYYNDEVKIQISAKDKYINDDHCTGTIYYERSKGPNLSQTETGTVSMNGSNVSTITLNGCGKDADSTVHGDVLKALSIAFKDPAGNPAVIKVEDSKISKSSGEDWANEDGTIKYTGNYIEVDNKAPTATLNITYGNGMNPTKYYTKAGEDGVVFAVIEPTTKEQGILHSNKEVKVTAEITIQDANLLAAESEEKKANRVFAEGETLEEKNNALIYKKEVTVKADETGLIELKLDVADLAGNRLKSLTGPQAVETKDGEKFETNFPAMDSLDGKIEKTISIDRRPSSVSGALISLNGLDENSIYDGSFGGEMVVSEDGAVDGQDVKKLNSGIKSVEWTLSAPNYSGWGANKDGAAVDFDSFIEGVKPDKKGTTATYRVTMDDLSERVFEKDYHLQFNLKDEVESNDVKLTVTVEDNVGNITTLTKTYKVDNCAPRVSVTYDNNSSRNVYYFNQNRTATVTVTDLNYKEAHLYVNGEPQSIIMPNGENTYYIERTFAQDGEYRIGVSAEDTVGHLSAGGSAESSGKGYVNTSGSVQPWEFVIDKTAPVISVTYSNNSSQNGRYYKNSRTAQISITETNYDAGNTKGTITATLDGQQIAAPTLNLSSQNSSVSFTEDGDYTMKIECTDKAGNVAVPYTASPFTIDQTAPNIEINVEDHSANTGNIMPEVLMTDVNFDQRGWSAPMQVLTGLDASPKASGWSNSNSSVTHGVKVSFVNLQKVKENDGVYILTAKITDLAGNESTKTVNFSVNRFGSTYIAYDEATQKLLDSGYGKTAPTLVIQEINPNTIKNEKIVLSSGSESVTLKKGTDYTVQSTTGKDCWNGAIYTVNASVFERNGKLAEGTYELSLYSEDSANHSNSNRVNEAGLPIRFTLDTSAPVVVITGIDDGDRIRSENRDVTLFYSDSSGIKEIIVYLDGQEYLRLSAEEIAKHPDSYTFTIDQSNSNRVLTVSVLDKADNEVKTEEINFFLNSSVIQQYLHNTLLLVISIVVFALLIALIFLTRRKKRTHNK